jgi:hypothetical protein
MQRSALLANDCCCVAGVSIWDFGGSLSSQHTIKAGLDDGC